MASTKKLSAKLFTPDVCACGRPASEHGAGMTSKTFAVHASYIARAFGVSVEELKADGNKFNTTAVITRIGMPRNKTFAQKLRSVALDILLFPLFIAMGVVAGLKKGADGKHKSI